MTDADEGKGSEPDYRALYEQARARSHEWEKRAKANKAAADELTKAQEAGKTAEERIAELTRRLDEKERAEARAKVAAEKGVPADLLVGDTEEEMGEWADRMRAALAPAAAPEVDRPGSFARDAGGEGPADGDMRGVLRQLFDGK